MKKNYKALYNLPKKVVFCNKCILSNQVPASIPEFKHLRDRKGAKYVNIGKDQICDPCKTHTEKENKINWEEREQLLLKILEKHRSNNNQYDCLVPGSGGKDSAMQAHLLKYKYGMNPLCITWDPILPTDYGRENLSNFIKIGGFDNMTFTPNGEVMRKLTRLGVKNLLHPFQTFILGQKNLAPKIASKFGIELIFYGENNAEYNDTLSSSYSYLAKMTDHAYKNLNNTYLSGLSIKELIKDHDFKMNDLKTFLPAKIDELKKNLKILYLGYFINWIPQEAYYYAVENTGFKARPFRTQGTYNKYSSIDDKIDDLHFYTTFIKFGIGRTTYDGSQEIRNNHITRDEAKVLAHRFEGEFPDKYFSEVMEYLKIKEKTFFKWCDDFRSPHLWTKKKGKWKLRHNVNKTGEDD